MADDSSAAWDAAQAALERFLLARANGESLDLLDACGGDERVAARVREVLSHGRGVLDDDVVAAAEPTLRSFGDYEVVRRLGGGGMGAVFLARQHSLGRLVAIKIVARGVVDLPAARLRLRREAELTALLDHPNIVPVHAVGEVDGAPFLVMRYVAGPSLADVPRPMAPERVARLGRDLARGLDAAHRHGVVHRDVKPANVLLDGDTPVLVDFGLARAESDPTLTQEGKVAGTLRYMAPERLDGGAVVDARVDVYGLGATLYELLSTQGLFAEATPTALVRAILTREPTALRLRGRHHDLETIVLRALAKEPERRFPSAAAMAADLERYLAGEPITSRRVPWFARAQRVARRYPRASIAVVASTLAAVAFATVWGVTALRAAADRDRRVAVVDADLAGERDARALTQLELLDARFPGDAGIAARLASTRAQVAFDRLLVLATDRSSNVDAAALAALRHELRAGGEAPTFAAVLAAGHLGGPAAGVEELERMPPERRARRTGVALRCWLAAAPLPWSLPAASADAPADERVVAALVLRLARAAPEAVLAELTAAHGGARTQRTMFLEAIVTADAGDLIGAERLLRGLADVEAPPSVWRWLGYLRLQLGRFDEARAALARADASPSAEFVRVALDVADPATPDAAALRLADLRAAPRLAFELERLRWEYDGKDDPARTRTALAQLEAMLARPGVDGLAADFTLASMIEVAAWHLPDPGDTASANAHDAHLDFLDEWADRALGLRHAPAAAIAQAWIARSQCGCGGPHLLAGLDGFAAASARRPLHVRIVRDYAAAVARLPAWDPLESTCRHASLSIL